MADTPDEAIEKIKADFAENSPTVAEITIESITEILDHPAEINDLPKHRTLN